ncbi:hypothetical protein C8R43DRAFT_994408 [Mycena crocata]|nr:hypothetical protein C8R43DRAFT_994408 [Mycena crocata]
MCTPEYFRDVLLFLLRQLTLRTPRSESSTFLCCISYLNTLWVPMCAGHSWDSSENRLQAQMRFERCSECTSPRWIHEDGPEPNSNVTTRSNEQLDNSNEARLRARDVVLSAEMVLLSAEVARLQAVQCRVASERQDLRAKLSTIPVVPAELWAEIFETHGESCRADIAQEDSNERMAVHFPLMCVCRKWCDIVVATPSLWAFIALYMGTHRPLPVEAAQNAVDLYLSRSSQHLLDVVVSAYGHSLTDITPYSHILRRLLMESKRMRSLVLDIPLTFPFFTKLDGPFDTLHSLTITDTRWSIGTTADDFWRELRRAPIRSLAVEDTPTEQIQFAWERIEHLRTDRVELVMERLGDPSFTKVVNSSVRSLKLECRQPHSYILLQNAELPSLESLSYFVSRAEIQSLSLEIDFAKELEMLPGVLDALPNLRSLNVQDFWADLYGDMTPLSEDHPDWFAFPLRLICDPDVLPALEIFTYRLYPYRFSAGYSASPLQDNVLFLKFLQDVDNFLLNRINVADTVTASPLKKIVLRGGGKNLDDVPVFLRRIEQYEKNGLVFDYDETDHRLDLRGAGLIFQEFQELRTARQTRRMSECKNFKEDRAHCVVVAS